MEKPPQGFDFSQYVETYPLKYFFTYEKEQLNTFLTQFHGYFLVQLGPYGHYDLNSTSSSMQKIYVGSVNYRSANLSVINANYSELPFQSESIDVFILPHTLEFVSKPDKLLNEIYNVLIPGGKVILLGYNPFSFLGLFKSLTWSKKMPWCGKFYGIGHVKFWLRANGFSISYQKTFCYRPPLTNSFLLKKLFFLELLGQFLYPYWGSCYVLVAEKKAAAIPPIRMKTFTKKIPVSSGLPEPSTHTNAQGSL